MSSNNWGGMKGIDNIFGDLWKDDNSYMIWSKNLRIENLRVFVNLLIGIRKFCEEFEHLKTKDYLENRKSSKSCL